MKDHLKDIQTWMYGVITHVDGIEEGAEETKIEAKKWEIESIVAPSATMNSHERINIYRNSYFLRLIECLNHEFNGLVNALGEKLFEHFAWSYLQSFPSTSYTLNDLGKKFPAYLKESLEQSLNGQEPDWWQLFILDMARFERTFVEVFNGEGHEELIPNDFYVHEFLLPSPSVQIVQLNFPIAECIGQFRNNETDKFPNRETVNYVFSRNNYWVVITKVDDEELSALKKWMENNHEDCPFQYQTHWKLKGIGYPSLNQSKS